MNFTTFSKTFYRASEIAEQALRGFCDENWIITVGSYSVNLGRVDWCVKALISNWKVPSSNPTWRLTGLRDLVNFGSNINKGNDKHLMREAVPSRMA